MNRPVERSNLQRLCACTALAVAASAGCAAPFMTSYLSGSRRTEAKADEAAVDPVVAANDPKAAALRKALGQEAQTPEEALAGVLDELQEIGAIDPTAQQEVMADLKAAKPEHYGLIVEQFQKALEYRQQLAERERREATQLAADETEAIEGASVASATHVVSRRTSPEAPIKLAGSETAPADATTIDPPGALNATPTSAALADAALTAATTLAGRRDAIAQHATMTAGPLVAGDWRTQLDAAIVELERTVKPQPATVAELHVHLRLRALQLVAGREDDAYRPIPGASPAQQDYWSKQLFAMAAYLNSSAQLDDNQRAAAALVHLDEARSSLAQLATLQIRNVEFVHRVDGFGAYEPLAEAKFEPGQPVTLYAEVENFASTSAKEGYETRLGTSYQVVDATGRRIDGAQFPDVSDVCRGKRRDFHLQYGVTLPTRISPGEYRLELRITDHQSGKIGQTGIAFEINAER